ALCKTRRVGVPTLRVLPFKFSFKRPIFRRPRALLYTCTITSPSFIMPRTSKPMKPEKVEEPHKPKLEQLRERKRRAEEGGGGARVERQHQTGKWTAREPVDF